MLEALLFDLDGTLIKTNALHARAFERAFADFGYAIPADRIEIEIGKGADQLIPAVLGATAEAEHGDEMRKAWERHFLDIIGKEKVAVCPGAVELLAACREAGLRLALATSGKESVLEALEQSSGVAWRREFETVTTSNDAPASKPAPHILLAALQKLGLSGAVCAMVGDTPYDALASRGAGVACIGVETGGHAPEDLREARCRAVYADTAALLADLDEARHVCSPLEFALSSDKMEALMREALEQACFALKQGQMPFGAIAADARGKIISHSSDKRRQHNAPLAYAEIGALEEAGDRAYIVVSPLEPNILVAGALIACGVDSVIFALESPLDGAMHRLSAPRAPGQMFPRFLGGTLPDEARALWEEWLRAHPDDAYARSIVAHAKK